MAIYRPIKVCLFAGWLMIGRFCFHPFVQLASEVLANEAPTFRAGVVLKSQLQDWRQKSCLPDDSRSLFLWLFFVSKSLGLLSTVKLRWSTNAGYCYSWVKAWTNCQIIWCFVRCMASAVDKSGRSGSVRSLESADSFGPLKNYCQISEPEL